MTHDQSLQEHDMSFESGSGSQEASKVKSEEIVPDEFRVPEEDKSTEDTDGGLQVQPPAEIAVGEEEEKGEFEVKEGRERLDTTRRMFDAVLPEYVIQEEV